MYSDQLLGKRYRFLDGSAPDMTIVAVDPDTRKIRVHGADGSKAWLPAGEMETAIALGILIETSQPFALDAVDGADVGALYLTLREILKGQVN